MDEVSANLRKNRPSLYPPTRDLGTPKIGYSFKSEIDSRKQQATEKLPLKTSIRFTRLASSSDFGDFNA